MAEAQKADEGKVWRDLVYNMAKDKAIEALSKNHELFEQAEAVWKADLAAYDFSVKRYGDFLALFVSRGGTKLVTAINLGRTVDIKLVEGTAPDRKGTLHYSVGQQKDEPGSSFYFSWGIDNCYDTSRAPAQGYHYHVEAHLPYIGEVSTRILQEAGNDAAAGTVFYGSHNYFGPQIEGVTRPAQDDRIEFRGLGTTLFVPATKGLFVRDAIMAEIAKGYEPPAGSILNARGASET